MGGVAEGKLPVARFQLYARPDKARNEGEHGRPALVARVGIGIGIGIEIEIEKCGVRSGFDPDCDPDTEQDPSYRVPAGSCEVALATEVRT